MRTSTLLVSTMSLFAGSQVFARIGYPETRKDSSIVDAYHGTEVKDPYRWLEDDQSAETKAWVSAENGVTETYLKTIPQRGAIPEHAVLLGLLLLGCLFHSFSPWLFVIQILAGDLEMIDGAFQPVGR